MKAVVWTQPNCVFCRRVKEDLLLAGFQIVEHDIGPKGSPERDEFRAKHMGPDGRATTPQVYVGGDLIGTYEQTLAWLQAGRPSKKKLTEEDVFGTT